MALSPVGMASKNDILVILLFEMEKNNAASWSQVIMRYRNKEFSHLRFSKADNPSFGINSKGKGAGRIVLSAIVDDDTRLLAFGIDVNKPRKKDKKCDFTVAYFIGYAKIIEFYSYPISVCTANEVTKPSFVSAVSYDSNKEFSYGAVSGEL